MDHVRTEHLFHQAVLESYCLVLQLMRCGRFQENQFYQYFHETMCRLILTVLLLYNRNTLRLVNDQVYLLPRNYDSRMKSFGVRLLAIM